MIWTALLGPPHKSPCARYISIFIQELTAPLRDGAALDEIAALEKEFLSNVIGGRKSKEIPGNHVLLLDRRDDHSGDITEKALRRALTKTKPKHLRLIVLVGWKKKRGLEPEVSRVFP